MHLILFSHFSQPTFWSTIYKLELNGKFPPNRVRICRSHQVISTMSTRDKYEIFCIAAMPKIKVVSGCNTILKWYQAMELKQRSIFQNGYNYLATI